MYCDYKMSKKETRVDNRISNNILLGLLMLGLVVLIFFVTIVKLMNGGSLQGYDHVVRPELVKDYQEIEKN